MVKFVALISFELINKIIKYKLICTGKCWEITNWPGGKLHQKVRTTAATRAVPLAMRTMLGVPTLAAPTPARTVKIRSPSLARTSPFGRWSRHSNSQHRSPDRKRLQYWNTISNVRTGPTSTTPRLGLIILNVG